MTGTFLGWRDLDHRAAPDLRSAIRPAEGTLIVARCSCGGSIWRTPERFAWSHSLPSRAARLADPRRAPHVSPFDVVLTEHLAAAA